MSEEWHIVRIGWGKSWKGDDDDVYVFYGGDGLEEYHIYDDLL
jgi:hypothetical protein